MNHGPRSIGGALLAAVSMLVGLSFATGAPVSAESEPVRDDQHDHGEIYGPTESTAHDDGDPRFVAAQDPGPLHEMVFPVEGKVSYTDTWGACRSGCSRSHEGQDLMGTQLQRLIATNDGTVTYFQDDATPSGSEGNLMIITGDDGWEYWYIHINNDSPGTDDGRQCNPSFSHCDNTDWAYAPGIKRGARVTAGQHIAFMGDSGNAEACNCAHVHFELHQPGVGPVNPYNSLQNATHMVNGDVNNPDAVPLDFLSSFDDVNQAGCLDYRDGNGYLWNSSCRNGKNREIALRDNWKADGTGEIHTYGEADDQLLFCDWDGDGVDTPGVYRAETAFWLLSNSLDGSTDDPDVAFRYGRPGEGDIVMCGDWDGNGTDTVGLFRSSDNFWYLRNTNWGGSADHTFRYGRPGLGDQPLVGDWDGDGRDSPGIFRGSSNAWHLHDGHAGAANYVFRYGNPELGDYPVVGDFNGDGKSTIAVARGNRWYVKDTPSSGAADRTIDWIPGPVPSQLLAADWDGDGVDDPIVDLYRESEPTE